MIEIPRRTLVSWLISTTRPVLAPLAGSTLCRIVDLLAGVGLFSTGAWAVVRTAQHLSTPTVSAPSVGMIVGLLIALSLLKAVVRYGEQFLGHFVAFKALELLRGEIFRALVPRGPRAQSAYRSGDLMTRATKDVDRIEVFYAHTFAPAVSAVVVPSVVSLVMGVSVSWQLAGIAFLTMVGSIVLAPAWGWPSSMRSARATAPARAAVAQHVTDSIQGMSEVLGYGRSQERLSAMAQLDEAVAQAQRPAQRSAAMRRALVAGIMLLGPVALTAAGLVQLRDGQLDAAALAACVAALIRLNETARGVEEFAGALNASFAAAERVYDIVHAPCEVPDGTDDLPARPAYELRWEQVSYRYPTHGASTLAAQQGPQSDADSALERPQVLSDVSVRASAGSWTCIVGASGSGKSTLAALAMRCDDPTAGRVLIDGRDVRELRQDSLRQAMALVTQRAHLFRASVADNLRIGAPQASDEEMQAACRAAAIHEDIMAMDQGYDTLIGERGTSLSGGQRQRLSLARALLAHPSVYILDEFTSHLDAQRDAQVRAAVRQWAPQATVVEITHRLGHIDQADHVVVIDGGRAVQCGDPRDVSAAPGPLRTLLAREGMTV